MPQNFFSWIPVNSEAINEYDRIIEQSVLVYFNDKLAIIVKVFLDKREKFRIAIAMKAATELLFTKAEFYKKIEP